MTMSKTEDLNTFGGISEAIILVIGFVTAQRKAKTPITTLHVMHGHGDRRARVDRYETDVASGPSAARLITNKETARLFDSVVPVDVAGMLGTSDTPSYRVPINVIFSPRVSSSMTEPE